MQFNREIQRVLGGFLVFLGVISLTAAYWAVTGPERLLSREDNPRLVEARASIQRGAIVDRDGTVLVETFRQDDATIRDYLYPSMFSALGYYSLRYGTGGIEADFDALLSGNALEQNLDTQIEQGLLHIPQQGLDVQVTLDLDVQQQIVEAMGGHRGAVVVLSVPDGGVLGMVSLPTYDPNMLDVEWDALTASPGNPFFNRVLQGAYQPGAAIYSLLATTAIIERHSLTVEYPDALMPVKVGDVRLECNQRPPGSNLTLTDAYVYGCPAPFSRLVEELGLETIDTTFDLFRIAQPFILSDAVRQFPNAEISPETTPTVEPLAFGLAEALGQGRMTVTPLHMAAVTAAFINAGNAPLPYTLYAIRLPGKAAWEQAQSTHPAVSITTLETSREVQALMRQSVQQGTARNAARAGLDIGGQAALAYTGKETLVWFVGYVRLDFRQGAVVAVVLEDSSDLDLAAAIGGVALEAAAAAQSSDDESS